MSEGRVFHGSHNSVEILRYEGDIRHTLCIALDRYISTLLEQEGLAGFVVDLTAVDAIDSTNLGIMARLARAVQRQGLPKITVISNRPNINEILEAVGFDRVFNIVREYPSDMGQLAQVPTLQAEEIEVIQLMLDAHKALMELNDINRGTFKDVVQAFEKELGEKES